MELAAAKDRHAERARIAVMRDDFETAIGSLDAPFYLMGLEHIVIPEIRTCVSEHAMPDICFR